MERNTIHPMEMLQKDLKVILSAIPEKSKIYYMEYPVYGNVGDLLIMKGTERFFEEYEIDVVKRYSFINFKKGTKIPEDCIIVCQGGGNFGDLYPGPQDLREYLIENYPNNRVVILPQTIHYKDQNKLKYTAEIFNQHKDVHLFVRDENSYRLIKNEIENNVRLSPDMAHQLWPIYFDTKPEKELLNFIRTDDEMNFKLESSEDSKGEVMDWPVLLSSLDHSIIKAFQFLSRIDRVLFNLLPIHKVWKVYSDYLIKKSINIFSNYKCIRTSRLHGHILACLMDKENIVIDNSYGKNSTYYQRWTKSFKKSTLIK
ncbi:polysaccharide pyruvyl transferase family protein [Bacillus mobilis]|uniref:polysaccharide pyruvyl transferase family protein n=1 Tax=Bacillus mobilis TaxID=2026190 RepID=UPI002FDBB020